MNRWLKLDKKNRQVDKARQGKQTKGQSLTRKMYLRLKPNKENSPVVKQFGIKWFGARYTGWEFQSGMLLLHTLLSHTEPIRRQGFMVLAPMLTIVTLGLEKGLYDLTRMSGGFEYDKS